MQWFLIDRLQHQLEQEGKFPEVLKNNYDIDSSSYSKSNCDDIDDTSEN